MFIQLVATAGREIIITINMKLDFNFNFEFSFSVLLPTISSNKDGIMKVKITEKFVFIIQD